jgi:hypothetical protein
MMILFKILKFHHISCKIQRELAMVREDDCAFDNHMAQQEHGARSRYRHSIANLYFNNSEELEQPRGNRVEGGLSGGRIE